MVLMLLVLMLLVLMLVLLSSMMVMQLTHRCVQGLALWGVPILEAGWLMVAAINTVTIPTVGAAAAAAAG